MAQRSNRRVRNSAMGVRCVSSAFVYFAINVAILLSFCMVRDGVWCEAKVFERCELAQVLHKRHGLDLQEVANWVCIAQHSSGFNSGAYASGLAGGSHGLFQISDVFWCSPPGKGFACNVPCEKLRDDDLTDDLACLHIIYAEHQRISGNGYNAWNAYPQFCKNGAKSYIAGCFPQARIPAASQVRSQVANLASTALSVYSSNFISGYTHHGRAKIYGRCELAQELYYKHKMPMDEIPTWVCIAQHESNFDTSAVGRLNVDGSLDHGLFQISDLFWCSHDRYGGKSCGLPCNKLLDADISDDVRCIRRIHNEHTGISGDGFTAWTVYNRNCRNQHYESVAACFKQKPPAYATTSSPNAIAPQKAHIPYSPVPHQQHRISANPFFKKVYTHSKNTQFTAIAHAHAHTQTLSPAHYNLIHKPHKGKVYNRCELAQELYFKHKFPMQDIATWVCIAQHESNYDTSAVGRLNGDGSADHGLFQISDLYWCSHDSFGGKACDLPCHKLLDSDLTDDVKCARTIHAEHTRISGDGFTAWTVYNRNCLNQQLEQVSACFDDQEITKAQAIANAYAATDKNGLGSGAAVVGSVGVVGVVGRGKVYKKCELAQELYTKHKLPLEDIATWVCIVEHESNYDTSAVGRLNTDGSEDHGLFQISDLYWCSHEPQGGKACNIPCNKLLDNDIADDVRCIKIIYEEHTRISGDGFTAWTVYNGHCRNQRVQHISSCFDESQIKDAVAPSAAAQPTSSGVSVVGKGKVYKKCELAQELYFKHKMPMVEIPTWVCIAQYESSFDTSAVGRLNTDGSLDHGLFQISDLYWCSHEAYGGKACNIPCSRLLDNDITDDLSCVRTIYAEHTRISGDGFTAWTVYNRHCRNQHLEQVQSCFDSNEISKVPVSPTQTDVSKPVPHPSGSHAVGKGKVYKKCELAQELYFKHKMPMVEIPTWVCIAQYESSFDTSAVGRLNTDGSLDHGLFQISDLYWCSHEPQGGKACNIPCNKLLDNDITDDVRCIKIIYEEHTRISGDGFTAWTVYNGHCRNQPIEMVSSCFDPKEISKSTQTLTTQTYYTGSPNLITQIDYKPAKKKIYKKCELAQELYFKHKMPMSEIPTWVCIVQHESSFDTSAVGRLNTDGSLDHGLFQISDLYWCSHEPEGGKACNIPCSKLLDTDITDDVRCVKIIYEEHTRISGDGFTAWTVYNRNCRHQNVEQVSSCFDSSEIAKAQKVASAYSHLSPTFVPHATTSNIVSIAPKRSKSQGPLNHPYVANPFLNQFNASGNIAFTSKHKLPAPPQMPSGGLLVQHAQPHSYAANPFLQKYTKTGHGSVNQPDKPLVPNVVITRPPVFPYASNPFLNQLSAGSSINKIPLEVRKETPILSQPVQHYQSNPFLNKFITKSEKVEAIPLSTHLDVTLPSSKLIAGVQSYQHNPFLQKLTISSDHKPQIQQPLTKVNEPTTQTTHKSSTPVASTKSYLNSDVFRTMPVAAVFLQPTTTSSATEKPTTTRKEPITYTKPQTTITQQPTTTIKVPTTAKMTATISKTTTASATTKATVIRTTTKKPLIQNTTTRKPITTTRKMTTTFVTTTKSPYLYINENYQRLTNPTTTKKPYIAYTTNRPTTVAATVIRKPSTTTRATTTTTKRPNTTWNWRYQKTSPTTTKRPTPITVKAAVSTTNRPSIAIAKSTISTSNWHHTLIQPTAVTLKTNKATNTYTNQQTTKAITKTTTTTKKPTTALKVSTTTTKQHTTANRPTATTTATRRSTTTTKRPNTTTKQTIINGQISTTKSPTTTTKQTTTNRLSPTTTTKRTTVTTKRQLTTTKRPTTNYITTTRRQTTSFKQSQNTGQPTTNKSHLHTTTTPRNNNITTITKLQRQAISRENAAKYKNDPFSHPFFAKYNEQFQLLFKTTTRKPSTAPLTHKTTHLLAQNTTATTRTVTAKANTTKRPIP